MSVSKIRAVASSSDRLPSINGGSPRLHRGASCCQLVCSSLCSPWIPGFGIAGVRHRCSAASIVAPRPEAVLDEPAWTVLTTGTALAVFQLAEIGRDRPCGADCLSLKDACFGRRAADDLVAGSGSVGAEAPACQPPIRVFLEISIESPWYQRFSPTAILSWAFPGAQPGKSRRRPRTSQRSVMRRRMACGYALCSCSRMRAERVAGSSPSRTWTAR